MSMVHYDLNALSRLALDGLLNSLIAGIAVAILAWTFSVGLRRQGSGARFAVWLIALAAVVVLPLATRFANHPSNRTAPSHTSALTLPESFALYLFVAWTIGAVLGLVHVAFGFFRLRRLRASCAPVDPSQLDPILRATLADARKHRPVMLCTSDNIRVPAAVGYLRPIVVFPSWTLNETPPAELHAILLHELAHLRRWDDWTNLAQKIVKAIFFFHPAVWFIESRLTLEREMACDDAVLAADFNPRAYAESLVGLAEKSFLRRGIQLAQAAVGHVEQLKLRLQEILRKDKSRQGSARFAKPAIAAMSLAGIILVYASAHAPHLIAFTGDSVETASVGARTLSRANEPQLQPVNLNYADRPQLPVSRIREAEPTRLRLTHHVVTKPRVLLARRAFENQMENEFVPQPILEPSNFPAKVTPAPVLVVFQGEQFGANGPIFWRVTVVHLTPAQQRAITGGVSKQI